VVSTLVSPRSALAQRIPCPSDVIGRQLSLYVSQLSSPNGATREGAIASVKQVATLYGPNAACAVTPLFVIAQGGDVNEAREAIRGLQLIGAPSDTAVPLLIYASHSWDFAASEALGAILTTTHAYLALVGAVKAWPSDDQAANAAYDDALNRLKAYLSTAPNTGPLALTDNQRRSVRDSIVQHLVAVGTQPLPWNDYTDGVFGGQPLHVWRWTEIRSAPSVMLDFAPDTLTAVIALVQILETRSNVEGRLVAFQNLMQSWAINFPAHSTLSGYPLLATRIVTATATLARDMGPSSGLVPRPHNILARKQSGCLIWLMTGLAELGHVAAQAAPAFNQVCVQGVGADEAAALIGLSRL
jgi:hypothetical protein